MYELDFAQQNLPDLFARANAGEEVIIVRVDGRACALVPLTNVQPEATEESSEEELVGVVPEAVPA